MHCALPIPILPIPLPLPIPILSILTHPLSTRTIIPIGALRIANQFGRNAVAAVLEDILSANREAVSRPVLALMLTQP